MCEHDRHVGKIDSDVVDVHRVAVLQPDASPSRHPSADSAVARVKNDREFGLVDHFIKRIDRAIVRVKRERLFRSRRQGGFLHRVFFEGLHEMQEYLDDHLRLVRRARWSVDPATRRRWHDDRFSLTRPVKFELLERL